MVTNVIFKKIFLKNTTGDSADLEKYIYSSTGNEVICLHLNQEYVLSWF